MSHARKHDGKPHAGSNKTRRRQREYQAHVHAMIAGGYANRADGGWGAINGVIKDSKAANRAEIQASRFSASAARK